MDSVFRIMLFTDLKYLKPFKSYNRYKKEFFNGRPSTVVKCLVTMQYLLIIRIWSTKVV